MGWFISSQKAATRFLSSQRYNHHILRGGSVFQFLQTPASKAIYRESSRYSSTSTVLNDNRFRTSSRNNKNDNKKVDIQIISRETIKPTFPTPHHLRIFDLSIFDQLMIDVYNPFAVFIPNNDKASITHVVAKRSKQLKDTLSEILTRFYPFAGEIKDDLHIECNDKGVRFVEARVCQTLEGFLHQPDDEKVRQLIPTEPSSRNHIASIQVNIFDCGGIALNANLSHKIVDGHTYFLFMNAWAAAVRGSPEKILPSFVGSKVFPNNPSLKYALPSKLLTSNKLVTKRFVFDSTAMASLKGATAPPTSSSPSHGPTRTEATGALIWKAASKAASTIRAFGPQSPHFLFSAVNLRNRSLPPLPKESIGNLSTSTGGVCFPQTQPDLPTLMGEMRRSIAEINSGCIEAWKGEQGHKTWDVMLEEWNQLFDNVEEGDFVSLTSLLNSKVREIDFGWGKPVWFYYVNPGLSRLVTLSDTMKVGGVEAVVSLSPEEMAIFERDPEILSYTTVDSSPVTVS